MLNINPLPVFCLSQNVGGALVMMACCGVMYRQHIMQLVCPEPQRNRLLKQVFKVI